MSIFIRKPNFFGSGIKKPFQSTVQKGGQKGNHLKLRRVSAGVSNKFEFSHNLESYSDLENLTNFSSNSFVKFKNFLF